ncbi:MAG: hypothetical protein PGN29_18240 [Gordonia paraffinivorans]
MTTQRTITDRTLGAWVFKASGRRWDVLSDIADGRTRIESRCVADNYRTAMMRRGQRAILWLSGPGDGPTPRGVWGLGWITGPAEPDASGQPVVPTDITLLAPDDALRATDLREIRALVGVEVLRVPAASNPSWVDVEQLTVLREILPDWPPGPA